MVYAPIVIYTCNRITHFKRCVESLERNEEAKETVLYIALDYPPNTTYLKGYQEIEQYIQQHSFTFKDVVIFKRTTNFGPQKNAREALVEIAKKHDRYIGTEDDNEFSPFFLKYMNQALEKYKEEEKVYAICSYLPPIKTDDILKHNETFFYNGYTPYGVGKWFSKNPLRFNKNAVQNVLLNFKRSLKLSIEKDYIFKLLVLMELSNKEWGDVSICSNIFDKHFFCVFPALSLTRNHGNDGSGINCKKIIPWLSKQEIIQEMSEDFIFKIEIEQNMILKKRIDRQRKTPIIHMIACWIAYPYIRIKRLYVK